MNECGYLDIHTHILPGIDDGSRNIEMTKAMLQAEYEQGVRTIIATPHNYPKEPRQENEKVLELCAQVDALAQQIDKDFHVLAGNEVFYREGILRGIEDGNILTMADSRYILLEFHPNASWSQVNKGVREIVEGGYAPIVAHVERVGTLVRHLERIDELIGMGAYIQSNCESMMGGRFDKGSRRQRELIKNGMIHFLGSDCHNMGERAPVMDDCVKKLYKYLPQEAVDRLVYQNPDTFLHKKYI